MNTIYIKVLDTAGEAASVEKLTPPVYVCKQPRNGLIIRCIDTMAQGVLDVTGDKIYQLKGTEPIEQAVATAVIITTAEYEELMATLGTGSTPDPEDTVPEVPEGTDKTTIMTRAELTEKVNELDEAIELLLSGVTE